MSRIYLDHAATTPMVPEAVEAMTRELTRVGNASSLHGSGRTARRVVEESREAGELRTGRRRGIGLQLARELLLKGLHAPDIEPGDAPEHMDPVPGRM